MPYMRRTVLMGMLPAHRDSVALRCAMPDAPLFMAHDIHHALQEAGVMIEGAPTTDRILLEEQCEIPAIENILYAHHSDPLGEMVREMMYKSNNLYAESLLRYLSLSQDSVATLPQSLAVERAVLGQMGVDTLALTITDGSGLSRKNVATPQQLATLLVEAYHDGDLSMRFVSKLPQAGRDGSVRSFFAKKPLPGKLRVKSGSMSGVLCYAGYYQHAGKTYALVLMSNNHRVKTARVRAHFERFLRDIWGGE